MKKKHMPAAIYRYVANVTNSRVRDIIAGYPTHKPTSPGELLARQIIAKNKMPPLRPIAEIRQAIVTNEYDRLVHALPQIFVAPPEALLTKAQHADNKAHAEAAAALTQIRSRFLADCMDGSWTTAREALEAFDALVRPFVRPFPA